MSREEEEEDESSIKSRLNKWQALEATKNNPITTSKPDDTLFKKYCKVIYILKLTRRHAIGIFLFYCHYLLDFTTSTL